MARSTMRSSSQRLAASMESCTRASSAMAASIASGSSGSLSWFEISSKRASSARPVATPASMLSLTVSPTSSGSCAR
eukprot:scaffold21494_cov55-Phaeocystis_antarctica.AAC.5